MSHNLFNSFQLAWLAGSAQRYEWIIQNHRFVTKYRMLNNLRIPNNRRLDSFQDSPTPFDKHELGFPHNCEQKLNFVWHKLSQLFLLSSSPSLSMQMSHSSLSINSTIRRNELELCFSLQFNDIDDDRTSRWMIERKRAMKKNENHLCKVSIINKQMTWFPLCAI